MEMAGRDVGVILLENDQCRKDVYNNRKGIYLYGSRMGNLIKSSYPSIG